MKASGASSLPCMMPGCPYLEHSDPQVLVDAGGLPDRTHYCCNKCAGRHAGEEWAEGGIRHYAHCEKRAHGVSAGGGAGDGKGSGRGGGKAGRGNEAQARGLAPPAPT